MWKCAECGEDLDDQFDSCWKCGTRRDGTSISIHPDCNPKQSEGSAVLGFCTMFAMFGIFISLGFGIYLFSEGSSILGILVGGVGAIYNGGLFIVFCEVNRIIGERKTKNNHASKRTESTRSD